MKLPLITTSLLLALASSSAAWNLQLSGSGSTRLKMHGRDYTNGKCIDLKKSMSVKHASWDQATDWISDPKGVNFYEKKNCNNRRGWLSDKLKSWTFKKAITVGSYQITKSRPKKIGRREVDGEDYEDYEDEGYEAGEGEDDVDFEDEEDDEGEDDYEAGDGDEDVEGGEDDDDDEGDEDDDDDDDDDDDYEAGDDDEDIEAGEDEDEDDDDDDDDL
ncbi:hypothetical protein AJ79_08536 [Helicocarpus griseus UAMH5409]|uniref:Uncharacterized protein n=1 Tax=Helicocarpus griseus UAMH5409 TaxID=1447875 RepID=A0A2B7WSG4_9EURO|nr:hypothetical protein AJ79_08536 [Helicocarpus griseus UAMH5409]